MITDVLFKRYPQQWVPYVGGLPGEFSTVLRQAASVLYEDIAAKLRDRDRVFSAAHQRLTRELGVFQLAQGQSPEESCMRFLVEPYDLWNDAHGGTDRFFKLRLSLIELLLREAEAQVQAALPPGQDLSTRLAILRKRVDPQRRTAPEQALEAVTRGVHEINERFREARLSVEYHDGIIQRIDDALTAAQIEAPFWALVGDAKWKNVSDDMKEAIDRRDNGKGDAAFYALKALESTIKILSDDLALTRGNEIGAAHYIDNLVSKKNGRYVEGWEADAMKHLFGALRNPQGHGPGSAAPLVLTGQQSTFVIESTMAWVKSLVRRSAMPLA